MVKITDEILDRVAVIARMKLTPEEKKKLKKDLEDILQTFSEVQDIPIPKEEVYYITDAVNPLREDGEPVLEDTKLIWQNIPKKEGRLIKVPRGL